MDFAATCPTELASLILRPAVVRSGGRARGTLRLTRRATANLDAALADEPPGSLDMPAIVRIPAERGSARFELRARAVSVETKVVVSPTYEGQTVSAAVTLRP